MSSLEICAHCGSKVAEDAERCGSCGSAHTVTVRRPTRDASVVDGAGGPEGGRPKRRSRAGPVLVFLLAGVAVGLATVGGIGAFLLLGEPAAPPPPVTKGTASGTPTGTAGGFAAIRERGALRVAADPDAAPFLSRTADGGYEGFEYGVMSALAADAGVPLTVVASNFTELAGRLAKGEADLAIGQMSPSGAWAGLGWSTSYLQYSHCLVVPKRSSATTLAQLRGKRIGMYDDPVTTQLVTATVGAAYERVVFDDYGYFEKLARGRLDAVVYDCPLARHELGAFGERLRIADDALDVATYNVALPNDDAALKADVNRVLRTLGDQGLLARLESRWLGAEAPKKGYRTAAGRVVVVQRGETLSAIAARELGSAQQVGELHAMNRDVVGSDPDAIYPGLRLRVGR